MATDYNYDEQGQFFPFFILTIAALITLPLTYSLLKPSKGSFRQPSWVILSNARIADRESELESTAPRIKSDFKPVDEDLIQGQKRKQWRRERRLKRITTVVFGYATIAWMIYLIIVTARTIPKVWDPYSILGISRSSSEKQIKRRYKDLSLIYHPDKARPDESKNQTLDTVNDYWVELSKAYKALTDEEVRNNFIKFGHPDGRQSFSIGIALPKFIITDGNGKYVLLVYGLLLGVLLPYVVGKWWYGTQRMTREKVLIASAGKLFKEYTEDMDDGDVVNALSCAEEFQDVLKGNEADSGTGKIEQIVADEKDLGQNGVGFTKKDLMKLKSFDGVRRKVVALLWAYLGRKRVDGSTLDDEKYEVAPLALALNESLLATALAYGNVAPVLSVYRTSQNLIQAVPHRSFPLLQLPHITPSIARAIEGSGVKNHMTVQQFMEMPEYKRRKLATNQDDALTPSQYNDAVAVARQLPYVRVEKAFFKVMGEKFITPGSLVQLVVKARVIPPGSVEVPPVNELDLEDVDPDEGDLDVLLGRKSLSKKAKMLDGNIPPSTSDEKPLQPPLAYAPYFPRDHSPRWHVFLADGKVGKIAVPPSTFTTFNKPLFDDSGKPTFNMQTFKMQFQAPPQVTQYPFIMHLICDSYVGMDSRVDVVLNVEDSTKAAEMKEEDEISEPDEDSIAGQMNALKTGGLPSANKPKRSRRHTPVESSDDESDTDGEAGQDTSDTDTETDTDGE